MCGSRRSKSITAGGITRNVSAHLAAGSHPDVTLEMTAQALEGWVAKGVRMDVMGRESTAYLGWAEDSNKLLRVAVSMDDRTVTTSFKDSKAWENGNWDFFHRHYRNFEASQ